MTYQKNTKIGRREFLIAAGILGGGAVGLGLLKKYLGPSIVEKLEELADKEPGIKEITVKVDDLFKENYPLISQIAQEGGKYVIIGKGSTGTKYKYSTYDHASILSDLVEKGELKKGDELIFKGLIEASDLEKAAKNPEYSVPVTNAGIRRPDGSNPLL